MGNFMRRFWAPVALASEVGGPDSTPVRVNVLGEKLVLFRDSSNRLGLIDAYCPHRRANMYWGRNEADGLRCVYHGWKFDVNGQCTDLPNCPEGVNLAARVSTTAYTVREQGGLIWAYMGPPELEPPFPKIEIFDTRPEQRRIHKLVVPGNYFQMMEGDMDSSHVSFLHSKLDNTAFEGSLSRTDMFEDRSPRWFASETDYGLMLSAQRDAANNQYQWRVTQYLMPFVTLIAVPRGERVLANVRIPIDDENSILFRCFVHPDRDLNSSELATIENGIISAETIPGTFLPIENMTNDYMIDRDVQRTKTFSGIRSIPAQDLAVAQDQGGLIADRSLEYLVSSDKAIITLRKRLLGRVKELMAGTEPPEAQRPDAYGVRAVDFYLPRDVELEAGARELLLAGTR
jgi:phenylpropionate dioxygenase-like ring-hydroxylating dioxygenase large terminal subunit